MFISNSEFNYSYYQKRIDDEYEFLDIEIIKYGDKDYYLNVYAQIRDEI